MNCTPPVIGREAILESVLWPCELMRIKPVDPSFVRPLEGGESKPPPHLARIHSFDFWDTGHGYAGDEASETSAKRSASWTKSKCHVAPWAMRQPRLRLVCPSRGSM